MLYTGDELRDFKLVAADGDIGRLRDFYFDDRFWAARYLVADTPGWLTERLVLVSPFAIVSVDKEEKTIRTSLTKAEIENSPRPDEDPPVSRQFEIAYHGYYGYSPYWVGPFAWGAYAQPTPPMELVMEEGDESWDGHLHSAREVSGVMGYRVGALDGEVGHVADLVIDDQEWAIRYLIVDTKSWWPSKHVLIAPQWAEAVDWASQTVSLRVTRDAVKQAPAYERNQPIAREYEAELCRHYGQQGYWSKPPETD